jgi:hypothetical protein
MNGMGLDIFNPLLDVYDKIGFLTRKQRWGILLNEQYQG